VPVSHRRELHADWIADLAEQLQDRTERPITRLVFGVKFAVSLVRGGRRVAVELGPMNRDASRTAAGAFTLDSSPLGFARLSETHNRYTTFLSLDSGNEQEDLETLRRLMAGASWHTFTVDLGDVDGRDS